MDEFRDKIVVVTGGAGNLGTEVVKKFYDAGARVAVIDRERDMVKDVLGDEVPEGDYCLYVAGNLLDEESVATMTRKILDRFGRIDVLVNIAGGFSMGPPLHETPLKTYNFMMDLNAKSVFLMSREVIPHMLAQGGGKIISTAARAGLKGAAKMGPYTASKAAVIRLTEAMAAELRDDSINVNCIMPGTIDTPGNRKDMPDADFSTWVQPESLADVFMFLASYAARDINGAAIPVYGRS